MSHHEDTSHLKTGKKVIIGVIFVVAAFFCGVSIGYQNRPAMAQIVDVVHKESPVASTNNADFNTFWKAWQTIDQKFPGADKISSTDRLYGAIKGLTESFGDPYTMFFPPVESKIFESQIAGGFDGIGVEIGQKEGVLTVIAPLKDTPGEKAGIKPGDKIIKINDTETTNFSIDQAIDLIRGKAGTVVNLTIIREGLSEPKMIAVTRGHIDIPTIKVEDRAKDDVYVIHLYNFSAQSARLFRDAMLSYVASGRKNLLLDLRGNPGGYLDAAVSMANSFIPEGKVIVREIGKTPDDVSVYSSTGPVVFPATAKLLILVDKGSASASEILAGALSDQGIGMLVGEQTFGKGSVQELVKLTSDTSLKVTVAKWYTPNGVSISEKGLTPAVIIRQATSGTVDTQLEDAIKLFK